jgi:hypothetical protein
MLKYYVMGIENGDIEAINILGLYYKNHNDYENAIKYCNMAKSNVSSILLEYIVDYNINSNNYHNVIHYSWIGVNGGNFYIVKKLFAYLLKCNNIKDILEVYIICCDSGLYDNDDLNEFIKIVNIDYINIMKYYAERNIKIYELINKYLFCNCISALICTF